MCCERSPLSPSDVRAREDVCTLRRLRLLLANLGQSRPISAGLRASIRAVSASWRALSTEKSDASPLPNPAPLAWK